MKKPIEELKIHPVNFRIYGEEPIEELVLSLEEYGLQTPIVINNQDQILSGHRRVRAFTTLGWNEIEYEVKEFETPDKELEYLIAANQYRVKTLTQTVRESDVLLEIETRAAKSRQGWKISPVENKGKAADKVAAQIGLKPRNYLKIREVNNIVDGIEDQEVKDFINNIVNTQSVDAGYKLAKEKIEMINKVKAKVDSGRNYHSIVSVVKEARKENYYSNKETEHEFTKDDVKIYNEDCRVILETLEDNSIDGLLTDPPYGIEFTPTWSPEKNFNDDSVDYVAQLMDDCLKLWQKKLKKDAHLYIFTGWGSYPWLNPIIEKYFEISNVLVWVKNHNSLCDFDKRYAFQYELIVFARQYNNDGNERLLRHKEGSRLSPDVMNFSRCVNQIHSCEKPIDLLEYLIQNSTSEGETILDCFAGTYNSALAAINQKRKYIGIEKDQKWFNIGLQKINERISKDDTTEIPKA